MTVEELLEYGTRELKKTRIKTAQLDAEILLCFVLKKSKEWLYINTKSKIQNTKLKQYINIIERRKRFEPVAYITNHKEFYGLDFYVDENVLIPRPETELLIEQLVNSKQKTENGKEKLKIVDIGTGSGNIIISIAKHFKKLKQLKKIKLYATDISEKALKIAKINAKKHKVLRKIKFIKSDLLKNINQEFNVIVSNPPYVLKNEKTSPEVKYEPKKAVFIQNEKEFFEKLLTRINEKLKPTGCAFIEIGNKQKKIVEKITRKIMPHTKIELIKDYAGIWRILKLQK